MKKYIFNIALLLILNQILFAQSWLTIQGASWGGYNGLYLDSANNILYIGNISYLGKFFAIAKWNGVFLDSLGSFPESMSFQMGKTSNELFVLGNNTLYKWNDTTWKGIASGIAYTSPLGIYNNAVYVETNNNEIIKWDGTKWDTIGIVQGNVPKTWKFTVFNNELYLGGIFTKINGITVNNIAKWNGTNWSALGTGVNGNVWGMAVYNGKLYVGGDFLFAGGKSVNRIAKWNGTIWDNVGIGMDGEVRALNVYNNTLYAGGKFSNADNSSANNIAKWDGTNWSALGIGVNNTIFDLSTYDNLLYVSGSFTMAGNKLANGIAMWSETVGINENGKEKQDIYIYPNPVKDNTIIEYTLPHGENKGELLITDITGREQKRIPVNEKQGKIVIDNSSMQSGIYFYSLVTNKGTGEVKKIVIMR